MGKKKNPSNDILNMTGDIVKIGVSVALVGAVVGTTAKVLKK